MQWSHSATYMADCFIIRRNKSDLYDMTAGAEEGKGEEE